MGTYAVIVARGVAMRARASLGWRIAAALAFGATAALAVTLSHGGPINAALASDKGAGAAHGTPTSPPSPAPAATLAVARCAVSGLRISVGAAVHITTAVTRYALEFTNVTAVSCTLAGYPQVTAYRGDDVAIGPAAIRDASPAARGVLLAPGATAHAALDALVPAARCRPVRASGLRVVPPGQTGARYVTRPLTACSLRAAAGQVYLQVRAVQPGAGSGAGSGTAAVFRPGPGPARLSRTAAEPV
jgi:Protein of unknown function (DUF4232)